LTAARLRLGPFFAGAFLILVYIQLAGVQPFRATAGREFIFISGDELRFWLAHWLIAAPGLMLLAIGVSDSLGSVFGRIRKAADRLSPKHWGALSVVYFVLLVLAAALGRVLFLLDMPITDDENLVLFGARMIANGDLAVPILQPEGAFTEVFTYRHEGLVSAVEYPGGLFFRALSLVSGLGSLLYALVAAGTGLAVAASARRLFGASGALIAGAIWLVSPMAFSLAMTTHSHLVSRFFLAVSIWLYLRLLDGGRRPLFDGAVLAVTAGLAFLTRSVEAACILLPMAIHLIALGRKDPRLRRAVAAATTVSVGVLALYALYNSATTGIWYLQARFGPGLHQMTQNFDGSPFERLGYNLGHNLLLLIVMALGPLGALLATLGLERKAVSTVLAGGIGLQIGCTLLYNDTGIHTVGPIHFSESLPALVLLATAGVLRVARWLRDHDAPLRVPASLATGWLAALGVMTVIHSFGLLGQASNNAMFFRAIENAGIENAIVLGQRPNVFLRSHPVFKETGSWVHWFPPPDPYFRDSVLYARPNADVEQLRQRFPDRSLYRLHYAREGNPILIEALD